MQTVLEDDASFKIEARKSISLLKYNVENIKYFCSKTQLEYPKDFLILNFIVIHMPSRTRLTKAIHKCEDVVKTELKLQRN